MTKIKIIFLTLLISNLSYAFTPVRTTIHINSKIQMSANPSMELEIGERINNRSAMYFGTLLQNEQELETFETVEFNSTFIFTKYKYFFNGLYQSGLYTGGVLSYSNIEYKINEEATRENGFGLGINAGYLWAFKNVTIGLNMRAMSYMFDTKFEYTSLEGDEEKQILPNHDNIVATLDFGYKF